MERSAFFLRLTCGDEFALAFLLVSLSFNCELLLLFFLAVNNSKLLLGKIIIASLILVERNIARQTPANAAHLAIEDVTVTRGKEGSCKTASVCPSMARSANWLSTNPNDNQRLDRPGTLHPAAYILWLLRSGIFDKSVSSIRAFSHRDILTGHKCSSLPAFALRSLGVFVSIAGSLRHGNPLT